MNWPKHIFIISIISIFICCSQPKSGNDNSHLRDASDTITKPIVLKTDFSKIIIFPEAYSRKILYKDNNKTEYLGFFSPERSDINYIETKLPENLNLAYNPWLRSPGSKDSVKLNPKIFNRFEKQYLGYVTAKNDSIILINVFNLESEPHSGFKSKLEKDFQFYFDGWFNSNSCQFKFNKNQKRFEDNMK